MKINKTCLTCNTKFCFLKVKGREGRGKFCSVKCYRKNRIGRKLHMKAGNRVESKSCINCGKNFTRFLSNSKKIFCSPKCRYSSNYIREKLSKPRGGSTQIKCGICSKNFKEWNYILKSTKHKDILTCSRRCANKKQSKLFSGRNSHKWKGGITPINNKIRGSMKYRHWQNAVLSRDNLSCKKCDKSAVSYLVAHHIKNFSKFPKLRFDINNGITFCRPCHKEFHKTYGKKDNTLRQVKDFCVQSKWIRKPIV
jgi:hypothetical protein